MICADCNRTLTPPCVSVAMRPGVDRQPWRLCVPCWVASTQRDRPTTLADVKPVRAAAPRRERQGQH